MSWPSILVGLFLYVPTRYGQTVTSAVVPPSSVAEDGNTNTWYPFFPTSIRYQQVYSASDFSVLTNFGGGWIKDIFFRGDGSGGNGWFANFPSVQFNLSTTARGPDNLSSVFAENLGADDAVVLKSSLNVVVFGGRVLCKN